jgi:hypothetical protein
MFIFCFQFLFYFLLLLYFIFVNLVHVCGEAFQHHMDHVHIAIVLITMLKIVLLQDNFLTILISI